MTRTRHAPALSALAVCLLATTASPQELRPQFGSRVEVARIQVSVADSEGRFVSGLTAEDFEVRIAGQARTLVDLLEVSVPDVPAAESVADTAPLPETGGLAVEATVAGDERTSERRHFVLFVDIAATNRRSLRYTKRILADFMDRVVEPEDRVALAMYSPFRGLSWPVPATSRHGLVREAIGAIRVARAGESLDSAFGDLPEEISTGFAFESLQDDFLALEAADMVAAISQVGEDLSVLEARKHLVLLSRGFGDGLYTDPGFVEDMERELERIRASDVVIHSLYPDRLPTSGSAIANRSFLYQVAEETGGTTTWFQHNADRGLREIDRATRSFYVLSVPVRPDDPDRLPLDIRLQRPGVSVRWAPVEIRSPEAIRRATEVQRRLQAAAALDPGFDPDQMSFTLRLLPLGVADGKGRFAVLMQMETAELERLAGERGDGSLAFEVLGVSMQPGGQITDTFRSRLEAEDRARDAVAVGALRYLGVFEAPAGRGLFKLLIREEKLGKLSARSSGFRVPAEPSTELWASSPLRTQGQAMAEVARSDRIDDDNYPLTVTGRRLVPDLDPLVRAGSASRLLVVLANLSRHPFSGEYQLLAGAQLRTATEEPIDLEWVRVVGIEPAAEPNMVRALIEVELPRILASGEAELLLGLTDAISGAQTITSLTLGIVGQ